MTTKIIQLEVECEDTVTSEQLVEDVCLILNQDFHLESKPYNPITEIKVIKTIKPESISPTQVEVSNEQIQS